MFYFLRGKESDWSTIFPRPPLSLSKSTLEEISNLSGKLFVKAYIPGEAINRENERSSLKGIIGEVLKVIIFSA